MQRFGYLLFHLWIPRDVSPEAVAFTTRFWTIMERNVATARVPFEMPYQVYIWHVEYDLETGFPTREILQDQGMSATGRFQHRDKRHHRPRNPSHYKLFNENLWAQNGVRVPGLTRYFDFRVISDWWFEVEWQHHNRIKWIPDFGVVVCDYAVHLRFNEDEDEDGVPLSFDVNEDLVAKFKYNGRWRELRIYMPVDFTAAPVRLLQIRGTLCDDGSQLLTLQASEIFEVPAPLAPPYLQGHPAGWRKFAARRKRSL